MKNKKRKNSYNPPRVEIIELSEDWFWEKRRKA